MKIEVSNGEIVDKWTIIQIKLDHITDKAKRLNLKVEQEELEESMSEMYNKVHDLNVLLVSNLASLQHRLKKVNQELWDVEDALREMERNNDWQIVGSDFVPKARSVYKLNDERARLKREINNLTGSKLIEEKSYEPY